MNENSIERGAGLPAPITFSTAERDVLPFLKDRSFPFVGEGAQSLVYDLGPEVLKVSKPRHEIEATVHAWNLPEGTDRQTIVRELIASRNNFIRNVIDKQFPPDIVGYVTAVPVVDAALYGTVLGVAQMLDDEPTADLVADTMVGLLQPKVETVNSYLEHASEAEALELFHWLGRFTQRQCWFGFMEPIFKVSTNCGVVVEPNALHYKDVPPPGTPLVIDAAESTKRFDEALSAIRRKQWRTVFNGDDCPYLPKQYLDTYYDIMDDYVTEDMFHATWRQHDVVHPDTYKMFGMFEPRKPSELVSDLLDDQKWRFATADALQASDTSTAIALKFKQPQKIYCYPTIREGALACSGLIARFYKEKHNPLLDEQDAAWYWSLDFAPEPAITALFEGSTRNLNAEIGLSMHLRRRDTKLFLAQYHSASDKGIERTTDLQCFNEESGSAQRAYGYMKEALRHATISDIRTVPAKGH